MNPAQIQTLLTHLGSLANSFSTLEQHIPGFVRQFEKYNDKFQKTKSPTGGGGGDSDKSWMDKLGGFAKKAFTDAFTNIDKITTQSLGRNTRLSELNIIKGLGVPISELAEDIFELRDLGFRNLNDSTQKLIARMKLTGQGTYQLISFLAENSYRLSLSNQESQELADSLTKSGQLYQISQEKTLQALNVISNKIGEDLAINLVGGTKNLMAGFTQFAQQLGMRNENDITKVFNAFFGQENLSKLALRIPGAMQLINEAIQATNPEEVASLMGSLVTISQEYLNTQKISARDLMSMNVNSKILETYGAENVKAINVVYQALKDNKQVMVEGQRADMTLEQIQRRFYATIQEKVVGIHGYLAKMAGEAKGAIEQGTAVAGTTTGIAAGAMYGRISGTVGSKILASISRRAAMAAVGSVLPGIGTAIGAIAGVGAFAYDLYDIYKTWTSDNKDQNAALKDIAQNTKTSAQLAQDEIRKNNKPAYEEPVQGTLSRYIHSQIMALGPGDKTNMQAKNVELLSQLSVKLDKLIDVSKDDRLMIPKGATIGN